MGVSLRSPKEMAAVFKQNKAKVEAYFAKQDLAAILPKLRSKHLISTIEEDRINSAESSKRANTLTNILERKIVNNPDLLQNLKQFLGPSLNFEDFSQLQAITIPDQTRRRSATSPQTPQQHLMFEAFDPWSDFPTPISPFTVSHPSGYYPRQPVQVHQQYGWHSLTTGNVSYYDVDQAPYHRYTASYSGSSKTSSAGLHTSQKRSTKSRSSHLIHDQEIPKLPGVTLSGHTPSSIGAAEECTPVSETKSSVSTSKSKQQPSQDLVQYSDSEAFPGIDFSSYRSHRTVDHRGHTIRGEGVQLRIPPYAIEEGTFLNISLQGCISGPFCLPEGIQLASPVFLIQCTPQYQFQRELTLTIHHFVLLQNREQYEDMVLLTSPEMKVEDEDYTYWKLHFSDQLKCFPRASYGEVELTHFSFLCFGIRLRRGKSIT